MQSSQAIQIDNVSDQPNEQLTALVVDDSMMQRRILTALLTRWGYKVVQASSGEEGLEQCRKFAPDIVLSDWMMPGISGQEFCQEFRKISRQSYGYFLMLTARGETLDIAEGLEAGADDFMTKPVNPEELRARLRAGERIVRVHEELVKKNRLVSESLTEIQSLYDALNRDLQEARKLQLSLVKDTFLTINGNDISFLLHPSGLVGGDLVGHFRIGEDKLGLFAIDVSGHGVSSALMTARLSGLLNSGRPERNIALKTLPNGLVEARCPADVADRLNDVLINEIGSSHYVTMAFANVDLRTGDVQLVQAGHPHPLVQRADGAVEMIGQGGMPIGLLPEANYEVVDLNLAKGDRLFLISDGVTECPATNGSDMLEEEGAMAFLAANKETAGPHLLEELMEELRKYSSLQEFPDDVSAVLFEYGG
ncbi:SpoIIE family protein phosphatase [Alphaproteobacteria bacterium KMM 3653]|uniref:SpoIIE family protein phosphatase n=1 Tax=Harenicola maris TaxID=2841044 RepID=A0AAP2CU33_9RHOB|nr:SpoIIE family protein phosphatase [Harenicola maris]